jgi:hypothetical protein
MGESKVDPTDSPPPRRMPWHADGQPGSSAGRGGGKRRPYGSENQAEAALKNSGLLRPDERPILFVHKHPAVLVWFTGVTLAMLAVAGWLSNYVTGSGKKGTIFSITLFHHVEKVASQSDSLILSIWLVWALVLLYLGYKIFAWSVSSFVITDRQMILTAGPLVRRFASVPEPEPMNVSQVRQYPASS